MKAKDPQDQMWNPEQVKWESNDDFAVRKRQSLQSELFLEAQTPDCFHPDGKCCMKSLYDKHPPIVTKTERICVHASLAVINQTAPTCYSFSSVIHLYCDSSDRVIVEISTPSSGFTGCEFGKGFFMTCTDQRNNTRELTFFSKPSPKWASDLLHWECTWLVIDIKKLRGYT